MNLIVRFPEIETGSWSKPTSVMIHLTWFRINSKTKKFESRILKSKTTLIKIRRVGDVIQVLFEGKLKDKKGGMRLEGTFRGKYPSATTGAK